MTGTRWRNRVRPPARPETGGPCSPLVPYVFDHATSHFGMFGMFAEKSISQLDPKVRELGILRTGYAQGSQFVFSQHCKAARRFGMPEEKIAAIPQLAGGGLFRCEGTGGSGLGRCPDPAGRARLRRLVQRAARASLGRGTYWNSPTTAWATTCTR